MILLLTFLCFPYQEWVALSFQRCSLTDYWVTRSWVWIQSWPKGGCWLPGKERGGGDEARAGVSSCAPTCPLPRWALPLQGEHRWPGQPLMMWRKGDEGRNTVLQPSVSPGTGRYKGGQGCGEIRKGTKRHLQGWKIKEAGTKEFLQVFFYPFSTLDVNSGKGYKLWIQSDIENAVLDGTTRVVQHPLMIQPSVRASGLSSWSCVFGGYVSREVIRCKITQYHPNLEHKTTSMLCLDCSYVSWQKLMQTPAFNPFKLNVSWWRSRCQHERPAHSASPSAGERFCTSWACWWAAHLGAVSKEIFDFLWLPRGIHNYFLLYHRVQLEASAPLELPW